MADSFAIVTTANLRKRASASVSADVLAVLPPGTPLIAVGHVVGDTVRGNSDWLQLSDGSFVWSGGTRPELPQVVAAGSFADRAKALAETEWNFFGQQEKDAKGKTERQGHTEAESAAYWERVGVYWSEGTKTFGIDGRNHDWYWSATFISWLMRQAGAGERFRYSTMHSTYISQSIRNRQQQQQNGAYWGFKLGERVPAVGDIVCWTRGDSDISYDNQKGGIYPGHTDLIVALDVQNAWIIGGNVGNSVTRRPVPRTAEGFLKETTVGNEKLFAIMACRI